MRIGFSRRDRRPTVEDHRKEAEAVLAARIAEGRPPPEAWLPRLPSGRDRRWAKRHQSPPIPAATWYLRQSGSHVPSPAPAGTATGAERGEGYDRPASRRALTGARPLVVKILRPQNGPHPTVTGAESSVSESSPLTG